MTEKMPPPEGMEYWTSGTGQLMTVHARDKCAGRNCVIHNPSDSIMKDWPTHWRTDRGIMERLCPEHGIGHMDFDESNYQRTIGGDAGHHGCCSCHLGEKL